MDGLSRLLVSGTIFDDSEQGSLAIPQAEELEAALHLPAEEWDRWLADWNARVAAWNRIVDQYDEFMATAPDRVICSSASRRGCEYRSN